MLIQKAHDGTFGPALGIYESFSKYNKAYQKDDEAWYNSTGRKYSVEDHRDTEAIHKKLRAAPHLWRQIIV